jgi:hypothetical protein
MRISITNLFHAFRILANDFSNFLVHFGLVWLAGTLDQEISSVHLEHLR